jgi:hypothetical protein
MCRCADVSMGCTSRHMSSMGRMCRRRGVCVVEGGYVSSKGGVCCYRRRYRRRYSSPSPVSLPVLWGLKSLVGSIKFVSWVKGGKMGENGPRNLSWPVFVTYFMGLPVLPRVFPSPITPSSHPHPCGKGCGWHPFCACGGLAFGPTSLKGGEGLQVGWMCVVETVLRWRRRGWWW